MLPKYSRRKFLAACAASSVLAQAEDRTGVEIAKMPGGGVQPQAVVDSDGTIHAIYLFGDPASSDIGYIRKAPRDRDFSAPIRVNDRPGSAIAIGTVRGARVALCEKGRVHVSWNGSSNAEPKGPKDSAPMLYTRLSAGGLSFEPQRSVMQIAGGLDGGGAVGADPVGNIYVAWHAQGHDASGKPLSGEEHRRVWLARSSDGGKTFSREVAVSPPEFGACGCCGMGALADSRGNLYLMYRSARELVHRDMVLLTSTDRGKSFNAAVIDTWEIGACPMSTVSLTEAGGRVFVSWERQGNVYFAPVNTGKPSIGKCVTAPGSGTGRKHPNLAVNNRGETLFVWTEGTGWNRGGSVAWQLFDAAGMPVSTQGQAAKVPKWGAAVAVADADQFRVLC